MTDSSAPLLAVDGTPLKRKLAQSMFRSRARAFLLALPLLAFIIVFLYSRFWISYVSRSMMRGLRL